MKAHPSYNDALDSFSSEKLLPSSDSLSLDDDATLPKPKPKSRRQDDRLMMKRRYQCILHSRSHRRLRDWCAVWCDAGGV